jgi:cytochrome b involved in lipid metabolism
MIPYSEVQKHDSKDDCWVVLNGKIYDLTEVRLFVSLFSFPPIA